MSTQTAIIILNWNGWSDTIECLDSLFTMDTQDFIVYIIDNHSTDDSHIEINEYIKKHCLNTRVFLECQSENLGFAKGSNVGIKKALNEGIDFIWLLNNDTVVQKNTLGQMIAFFEKNTRYDILTPCINYFSSKEIIWNCGGKISSLGFRKYYYANKNERLLPKSEYIDVTFLTNCASIFRRKYFLNNGILSERFFFGEEDFEMCLRSKNDKIKMACVLSAKIYHKVSMSINKMYLDNDLSKIYIYYLNRFVDMKIFFKKRYLFHIFMICYCHYIFLLLLANRYNPAKILKLIKNIVERARFIDSVPEEEFQKGIA